MQTLSNENTREIGRLRLELDDKTKQIYSQNWTVWPKHYEIFFVHYGKFD